MEEPDFSEIGMFFKKYPKMDADDKRPSKISFGPSFGPWSVGVTRWISAEEQAA